MGTLMTRCPQESFKKDPNKHKGNLAQGTAVQYVSNSRKVSFSLQPRGARDSEATLTDVLDIVK